jgi:hypothetical protein
MNAYYPGTTRTIVVTDNNPINVGDKLISFICMIVALFTSAIAVKIEKATLCTAGFVAFFGIIGSMENGNLGLLAGVFFCIVISLVEFAIFKSMLKSKKSYNK